MTRTPMSEGRGRLVYVQGEITSPRVEHGYLYFQIGGRQVCLLQSGIYDRFHHGDQLRLLLRRVSGRSIYKVLAWQRYGQRRVHYTGIRPALEFIMAGSALLVGGLALRSNALIVSGGSILVLQMMLAVWKMWTLHLFLRSDRWPGRQHAHIVEPVPKKMPDAPLDVHVPPLPSRQVEARNLPAEILEFTHDAIIIWEMGGSGILYWNRAAEQLYGYSRDEVRGRVTHELLQTELSGGVDELETRIARYGLWVGTLRHTCKDGRQVEVEGRLSLMSQDSGPWLVLEVNRDVTDRNAAELSRRKMEAQLLLLKEQRPQPVSPEI